MTGGPTRDITVAVFVTDGRAVLLHLHQTLGRWLPPGGHIEPNELPDEAAVREVLEETGVHATLGEELEPVRYRDNKGRPKLVRYWLMEVEGGAFRPNDEVDELRWMTPDEAIAALTYERDRELIAGSGL